jgi:hypothetical protein
VDIYPYILLEGKTPWVELARSNQDKLQYVVDSSDGNRIDDFVGFNKTEIYRDESIRILKIS